MATIEASGIDFKEYLAVVRRHILIIVALAVALGFGGFAYSQSKTLMYRASAQLLYEPQLDVTNPLGGQGDGTAYGQELQLQSASAIITSPDLAKRVVALWDSSAPLPSYSVSTTIKASDSDSGSGAGNALTVSVSSPDSEAAARLATAYADEFVAWRVENERARIDAAQRVIKQKLAEFRTDVQKQSSDYFILTERLRDLEILSATATGNFKLIVPATVPSVPYAPKPTRSAVMGAALGLLLGVAYAFVRERFNTSLRSNREVSQIMDLPVVGRIPTIPENALRNGPLVVVSEAEGRAAESLRALRSNLEFVSLGEGKRVLMIVSAQKGEGKSLVVANLAASMALAGKRVLLVDADLRRPRVHTLFKVRNGMGVSSVIAGLNTLEEALQTVTPLDKAVVRVGGNGGRPQLSEDNYGADARLWLLTSGPIPPNPGEIVASGRFAALIEELSAMAFDYILVDSPAFLAVGDATALAACVDGILLLVNLKMTKRPVLEEARDVLALLPAPRLGLITVSDPSGGEERYHYYGSTS